MSLSHADEPPVADDKYKSLIKQLGDSNFRQREQASEQLKKIGAPARAALIEATRSTDAEVVLRAKEILASIKWVGSKDDSPEAAQLLENYEQLQNDERIAVVAKLGGIKSGAGVKPLIRLALYEENENVAFAAAENLIRFGDEAAAAATVLSTTLPKTSAALRLLAWAQKQSKPADAAATLEKAIALEKTRLERSTSDSPNEERFLTAMLLEKAACHRAAGQKDACEKCLQKLTYAPETEDGALAYFDLLLNSKFPEKVVTTFDKLKPEVQENCTVLYLYATALAATNDAKGAEKAVQRALDCSGDNAEKHFQAVAFLAERDCDTWAVQELEAVLKCEPAPALKFSAYGYLAALADRRKQFLLAAEHYEKALKIWEEGGIRGMVVGMTKDTLKDTIRVLRMLDEYEKNGTTTGLLEALREHTKRSPDPYAESIKYKLLKAQGLADEASACIKASQDFIEKKFQDDPNNAQYYNGTAWLMLRTGQDLKKAEQLAEKAVSISPYNQSALDTLAEIYFCQGQVVKAIEVEKLALKVNPADPWLESQLKRFQTEKPPK